jgi:alpha-tubulin suppressor-like RCC1 family protein
MRRIFSLILLAILVAAMVSGLQAQKIEIQPEAFSSLAIHPDGTVLTWGYNWAGQLGDGTLDNRYTPIRVVKGAYVGSTYLGDNPGNPIIEAEIGYQHSIALATNESVYT